MADFTLVLRNLPVLFEGLLVTIVVSGATLICSAVLGLALALARVSGSRPLRTASVAYVEFFRNVPALQIIFLVFFGLPFLGISLPGFWAAVVALVIFENAYFAEIFRSGIESVSLRQSEAGEALGMTRAQVMRQIILPQGLVAGIPPLVSQMIFVVKDTSLVSTIGVVEVTKTAQIIAGNTATAVPFFLTVALMYLAITSMLGLLAARLEERLRTARH